MNDACSNSRIAHITLNTVRNKNNKKKQHFQQFIKKCRLQKWHFDDVISKTLL